MPAPHACCPDASSLCIGTLLDCANESLVDAEAKCITFRISILRALPRAQGAQRTVRGCYVIAAPPSRQVNAHFCVCYREVDLETSPA